MKYKAVISGTRRDKHGMRIAKEALEDIAERFANEPIPILVEHTPYMPPIGKVIAGRVIPCDDGEFELQVIQEYFEEGWDVIAPDGQALVGRGSAENKLPFVKKTLNSRRESYFK